MAEVYGVKPKMFTKEWWPYYWLYYKWHTVAVLFVVMLIVIALVECATEEKYDLKMLSFGQFYYEDSNWDIVEAELEADIADADDNGEKNVSIMSLSVFMDEEYLEQNYAMLLKHDSSFTDNLTYLYIYDRAELEPRLKDDFVSEGFFETDVWLNEDIDDEKLLYDKNGKAYAVSLKDSSVLKKAGIDGENLYLLVKTDEYISDRNEIAYNNAVTAANKLIK